MTRDTHEPVRLSDRYSRMAQLCRDYADNAVDSNVRDELLEMAEIYSGRATRESDREVRSNGVPPPSPTVSAFRFADLGRTAGLGAQHSEYGSD